MTDLYEIVWEPIEFKRPTAPPAPNWDVNTTKPNPYRPFRHGPYHITMGLRNMNWDEWIGASTFNIHIATTSRRSWLTLYRARQPLPEISRR